MRRLACSLVFSIVLLLVAIAPAGAWGVTWCRVDPIVNLNGTHVSILVAVPEEYARYVNGPIEVYVRAPVEVTRELVMTDAGFNGYGETVVFRNNDGMVNAEGVFTISIRVRVPIDYVALGDNSGVPVELTVDPGSGQDVRVVYGDASRTVMTTTVRSFD